MSLVVSVNAIRVPTLARLLGKRFQVEFPGDLVYGFVSYLAEIHGPEVKRILFDECGQIEETIMIIINEESILPCDEYANRKLKDGDSIQFLSLLGGG